MYGDMSAYAADGLQWTDALRNADSYAVYVMKANDLWARTGW